MKERVEVNISSASIIKVFVISALCVFFYWTREAFLTIFISLILAAAFQPIVRKWAKGIGKSLAVLLLLAIFIGLIIGFFYLIVPLLVEQTKQLIAAAPGLISRFQAFKDHTPTIQSWINTVGNKLTDSAGNVLGVTMSFIGGLVSFFTIVILTLYFLIDEKFFSNWSQTAISEEKAQSLLKIVRQVSLKIGGWLRGQMILGLAIAVLDFIGLSIIGVPYALTLAVISGLLEIVPIVGPFISGTIAALIALSVSPVAALITVIFYIIIQQLENNLLVPKIMQKAVGLPPAVIIAALLIFGKLLGIIGALLAVPIVGIISVLIEERAEIKKIFDR